MLKKTCLAALTLSLVAPLAHASAYTDKVADLQAKYELALKGDKAAAAYVCREGNLPLLKVRFIDRSKQVQACRAYAGDIAGDPAVYRWFMEWSMHLPHELISPVFSTLAKAGIYPVNKLNYLFAAWLYAEKKNAAALSEDEQTRLYREWVTDNYKAGHPGFAGLYVFLKTDKSGKSTLSEAEINAVVDNCLQKKDFESLKLFYSRLGEDNFNYVEKKLAGKPTHSDLDIARALTQDKLKLAPDAFAAVVKSAVESADARTLDSEYTTLCKIVLEAGDKSLQKTLFEKMLAYRIDPAKLAGAMDANELQAVVKPEFGKDGWAEAAMASALLSNEDYARAVDYFEKATALGFANENMLFKLADSLFYDAKGKVSAADTLRAHRFLAKNFFYPIGGLGLSFELYQLEKFSQATGDKTAVEGYYRDKLAHASSAKEAMEAAYRIGKHLAQTKTADAARLSSLFEKTYADISRTRYIPADGEDALKKPSAAQSIANGYIDASLFGINCAEAVKWYERTLTGPLATSDAKDLAAVYQDMGRCYLWAPEGDALKVDPQKASAALQKAYALVEKGDFPVYRGETPHTARMQEIASLLTDSALAAGNEKEAQKWAAEAVKLDFGKSDLTAADTAYTMGLYFESKGKLADAVRWYSILGEKSSAASDNNLANLYFSGKGLKTDPARAASLYTTAFCKAPGALHANNLALVYAEGAGVKQNPAYAWALYKLSDDKRARHGMMLLEETMTEAQKNEARGLNMRKILCK